MSKYDINAFYKNMQMIFEEREITYKEVYSAIGMTQGNFSNAYHRKNGKRFSLEQMLGISEFLGCSLDYMFTGDPLTDTEKYIQIPSMSKWTCKNLLELIFSLRKSGAYCRFIDTKAPCYPFSDLVDVTAIYFSKRFNVVGDWSLSGSNTDMLINSVIREWSQIQKSTENIDEESRELMLSTWEKKKIEQLSSIELNEEHNTYDIDKETKRYYMVSDK